MLTLEELKQYAEVYRYARPLLADKADEDCGIPIVRCYVMELRYLKHGSIGRLQKTAIGFGLCPFRDNALLDGFKAFINEHEPTLAIDMLLRPRIEPVKVVAKITY
ncbi:MAG: hypothetical protein V3V32_04405 [Dehalococcoidia bacterium]